MATKPKRKTPNLTFRGTPSLHARITAAAEKGGRSMSEEIEYRLQRSFDREQWFPPPVVIPEATIAVPNQVGEAY
jgi:hypothetical protein